MLGCYVGDEDPHPTLIYAIWYFSYTLLVRLAAQDIGHGMSIIVARD